MPTINKKKVVSFKTTPPKKVKKSYFFLRLKKPLNNS